MGLNDFSSAAEYVRHLPYRRISSSSNPLLLLDEACGTCSTKHQLLALLAEENGWDHIQLALGIYRMNPKNTPGIEGAFPDEFEYIPEAHCYLVNKGLRMDYTRSESQPLKDKDILEEIIISPGQMSQKPLIHQEFIQTWATERNLDPKELLRIGAERTAQLSWVG